MPIDGLESRNALCAATQSNPGLNKSNPACVAAYQGSAGDQPGYDPFGSLQSAGSNFEGMGTIGSLNKDLVQGQTLCGAGQEKYDGFNTPTSEWPYREY